jgi:hypothetical protein
MTSLKKVSKLVLMVFVVGVIVFFLFVGTLIFGPSVKSFLNQTKFNSLEWKSHIEDGNPVKINMVDDPPISSYFKDYDFVFWLGPERSAFGIDSEWLGIKFQDGKAVQVDILRD